MKIGDRIRCGGSVGSIKSIDNNKVTVEGIFLLSPEGKGENWIMEVNIAKMKWDEMNKRWDDQKII